MLFYTVSSDPNQSWKMTDFSSFSRSDHNYHSLSNPILLNMEAVDTRARLSSEGSERNQEGIESPLWTERHLKKQASCLHTPMCLLNKQQISISYITPQCNSAPFYFIDKFFS